MTETSDHIRRLADLYLTAPDAGRHAPPRLENARAAFVEVVIVGHLPVRAGLWLTQYADDVARDEGAVGLVRLDGEQLILEILRGSEAAAKASAAATLREGVEIASPDVRRWIIRTVQSAEPGALLAAAPDVVTILSGADEIAVVGAYRAVKDLCDAAASGAMRLPRLELAILGADREQAASAADRICQTASMHLDAEVTFRRSVRAMGALGSTLHFRFPSEHAPSLADLVAIIRRPAASRVSSISSEPSLSNAHPSINEEARPVEFSRDRLRTISTPISESGGFDLPGTPAVAPSFSPSAAPLHQPPEPVRLRPKPMIHVEAKPAAAMARPSRAAAPPPRPLSTYIDGLALLPIMCAEARDVEIAVDTGGRLHLSAWEDRLRQLHVAHTWLRKNRELIALACPDHSIAESVDHAMLHLFAAEPARVSDLYGGAIRLHLLAPVEVEGKSGWYSAPLSA